MSWSYGSQTQQNDLLVAPDHKTASTTAAFVGKMASLIPPPLKQALTELEQLSVKPRCAPGWIFSHHAEDQVPKLLAERSSSSCLLMPRTPSPIKPKAGSMPADHSLGSDNHKCFLPISTTSA